jgi:hypothetical protein
MNIHIDYTMQIDTEIHEGSSPNMGSSFRRAKCRRHYNELGSFLGEPIPIGLC